MGAALFAALVAGAAFWASPRSLDITIHDAPPAGMSWLHVVGGQIVDALGRTVLLHGFNVDNLTDPDDDELGPPHPLDERDAELMQEAGFDCARVPIAWSLLEPAPHRFDYKYLQRIVDTVHLLERHGLRVVLDMHFGQSWGPTGDVPSWLTLGSLPDWHLVPDQRWGATSSPRGLASYGYFWVSSAWQRDLAQAWQVVAAHFRDDPGVIAYDLFNEPHPIPLPPGVFGTRFLFPAYAHLIERVGAVDPNHLFLLEATLFFGLPTGVDPIRGANVVFSPHLYVGLINDLPTAGQYPGAVSREVDLRAGEASAVGAPLWFGEVGLNHTAPGAGQLASEYLNAMDAEGASWCWWEWRDDGGWGIRNLAGTHVDWQALRRLAEPYLVAAPPGTEGQASAAGALTLRVARDHAQVPATIGWPGLLSGTPHAAGACLAGQRWNASTDRLTLRLEPGRACTVVVR